MDTSSILATIDAEISRLEQARALLKGLPTSAKKPRSRRKLSAKARKAIADAQRKRWAAVRARAKAK
jgi:hypothetical protein